MAQLQEQNNLNQASTLLDLFAKYKGTSQTQTTTPNISKAGVDAMIQEILGGTQGLAAVANGQKAAGGYNSSTQQLLINDLLARTTAQVAKASAGTTTTTKTSGAGNKATDLALILGALSKASDSKLGKNVVSGAKSLYSKLTGEGADNSTSAVDSGSSALSSLGGSEIGGGSLGISSDNLNNGFGTDLAGFSTSNDLLANLGDSLTPAGSVAGDAVGGGSEVGSTAQIDTSAASDIANAATAAEVGSSGAYVSSSADKAALYSDTGYGATGTEASGSAGSTLGYVGAGLDAYNASQTNGDYRRAVGGAILNYYGAGWATPVVDKVARPISDATMANGKDNNGMAGEVQAEPIGTFISGQENNQGDVVGAILDPTDQFGGNPGGSYGGFTEQIADPIGAATGNDDIKNAVNGFVDEVSDTVICTELARQGRLSQKLYAISQLNSIDLVVETKIGYHFWAVPVVRKMRKSRMLSATLAPIVIARCEHISGTFNLIGALTIWIGEPICRLIGSFVTQDNWKKLYG